MTLRPIRTARFILPALTEATSPHFRPIKYALFPPLGLATLAAYLPDTVDAQIVDEHVMLEDDPDVGDVPDLVVIQVYITNAFRAYRLADRYRRRGAYVCLGGLHPTSLPEEAAPHADSLFLGPGEATFPAFLADYAAGHPKPRYASAVRTLEGIPPVRRDLIQRHRYFVPNSIVVTRGCPHHCSFCYKDAFFEGGKTFYTQAVDEALAEIDRLPGRHLYFLDDHLLGNKRFAEALFEGMRGMNRVFQGASTVDAILKGDLVEQAARAGLRSLFVGFETLAPANLHAANKPQNLGKSYDAAIQRLDSLGVMVNGSFVFGLDHDDPDVFDRTVEWGVSRGLTTATYHVLTPYPGTVQFKQMEAAGRILHRNWDLYDTRHVVYETRGLTAQQLEDGYWKAYRDFYRMRSIWDASRQHAHVKHRLKHLAYTTGWKKFEAVWDFLIRTGTLRLTRPMLEAVLAKVPSRSRPDESAAPDAALEATTGDGLAHSLPVLDAAPLPT